MNILQFIHHCKMLAISDMKLKERNKIFRNNAMKLSQIDRIEKLRPDQK